MKYVHQPVLIDKVLAALKPERGETYFDGTAGYGGHAAPIIEALGPPGRAILVDRDAHATVALSERFKGTADIMHDTYTGAAERLLDDGTVVDMILLDLGVSSPQFDNPERGFSFMADAPLDMRMDQSQAVTAEQVVNRTPTAKLAQLLREYGEEPRAWPVARAIAAARPITTTGQLAKVIRPVALSGGDIDPATRTFMAIRIAVNGELEQLSEALPTMVQLLAPGGRICVISFHSLEDRIVKQFFDRESRDCICPPKQPVCTCGHKASLVKITSKPVTADSIEIANNPRARSAKLRAAEKINKNKRRD